MFENGHSFRSLEEAMNEVVFVLNGGAELVLDMKVILRIF